MKEIRYNIKIWSVNGENETIIVGNQKVKLEDIPENKYNEKIESWVKKVNRMLGEF